MKTCITFHAILTSLVIFFVVCGLAVGADSNATEPNAAPQSIDSSVAVTVNGTKIAESDVEARIKPQLEKMAAQLPPAFVEQYKKQLRQQALEGMIVELLLDEKIKAGNVVITEQDTIQRLEEMASMQKMSLEEFRKLIKAYGQSFDDLKQRIKKGLVYQKLMDTQFAGKIHITVEDANQYYKENLTQFETPEQTRASHILIKPDTSDPNADPNQTKAEAEAKTRQLLEQIRDGANFATLARANSSCPSAEKGGDLGLFGRGQMVPAFEKAAFELKVGQVSDVVETQFGYHIIKATEHKDASVTTFAQAKDDIVNTLTQQSQAELAKEYVESLKAEANIVYPQPVSQAESKTQISPADTQAASDQNSPG